MKISQLSAEIIQEKLAALSPQPPINHFPPEILTGPIREAAVLIALIPVNDEWHLLFIRRTEIEGDIHSGQVAFPGGSREPQDIDLEGVALREAYEELGITPASVQVLGRLNGFITISNFEVTPIVGVVPWPIELILSREEVSRTFTIPLSWLKNERNYRIETRNLPDGQSLSVIYYEPYDGEILWGATALFTHSFLEAISS